VETSRLISCHLKLPIELSDFTKRPALSAQAESGAESPRGPCAGDADSARSFSLLRFWADATGMPPTADGRDDPAWGAALPAPPGLAVCALIENIDLFRIVEFF